HQVTETGPELAIRLDPSRAAELGISPKEVARALETSMLGTAESVVVSGERIIPVRVEYPRSLRRSLEQIRNLPILSKGGKRVPLSAIAEFVETPGVAEV